MSAQVLKLGRRKALALWGGPALLVAGVGIVVALQGQSADAGPAASGQASTAAKKQPSPPPTQPTDPAAPLEAAKQPAQPGNGNGGGNNGNGSGRSNNGKGGGNGAGTGAPGKALTVTATPPANMQPGLGAPFVVQVTNPNNQSVRLTEVAARITSVAPSACQASWFSLTTSTDRTLISAGQTLPVTLQLSMDDTTSNQDACKSATYFFSYTANADQA